MARSLLTAEEKKNYFVKFNVDGLLRGDYQSIPSSKTATLLALWLPPKVDCQLSRTLDGSFRVLSL